MLDKDPTDYGLLTYSWVIFLSMWGGTVSFLRKIKNGAARPFNIAELIGEIFTSGFVGVITFWLCEASNINPLISAAMVGVAGHMGGRALFLFELYIEQWLRGRKNGGL